MLGIDRRLGRSTRLTVSRRDRHAARRRARATRPVRDVFRCPACPHFGHYYSPRMLAVDSRTRRYDRDNRGRTKNDVASTTTGRESTDTANNGTAKRGSTRRSDSHTHTRYSTDSIPSSTMAAGREASCTRCRKPRLIGRRLL